MINVFDSQNFPAKEPDELTIGSRWSWKRPDVSSVYSTDSYSLFYRFVDQSGKLPIKSIASSKVNGEHVFDIPTTETELFKVGGYLWQLIVVRDADSEEVSLGQGFIELLPDLGSKDGAPHSHNYVTLQNIRAVIEKTATKEQSSYSVAGRSLSRRSIEELTVLLKEYEHRWKQEVDRLKKKSGKRVSNNVFIKMNA